MKIVIAMDSFKGTLSSLEAGNIIKTAFLEVFPNADTEVVSVADGGEGTVDAILQNMGGERRNLRVTGPLGKAVDAAYGIADDVAVVEMAAASGLPLLEQVEYDPLHATTYGTGELIKAALDAGAKKIIVGLGGSATNDAGAGMAQALGASFVDADGKEAAFGGINLRDVCSVQISEMDDRLSGCEVIGACDVTNPLCGEQGASHVYGPQKGADIHDVKALDMSLKHFSEVVKQETGIDKEKQAGAGAAGGLGYGLMTFCGAQLSPGIDIVLDLAGFDERVKDADIVVTGEGRIDAQTINGKTPVGVAGRAKTHGVSVAAIGGQLGDGYERVYQAGIDTVFSCVDRIIDENDIAAGAKKRLYATAYNAAKAIRTGQKIK